MNLYFNKKWFECRVIRDSEHDSTRPRYRQLSPKRCAVSDPTWPINRTHTREANENRKILDAISLIHALVRVNRARECINVAG